MTEGLEKAKSQSHASQSQCAKVLLYANMHTFYYHFLLKNLPFSLLLCPPHSNGVETNFVVPTTFRLPNIFLSRLGAAAVFCNNKCMHVPPVSPKANRLLQKAHKLCANWPRRSEKK